ncbi:unnamed protein product [Thlaspi arvense]|uniref:RING-type domain-containing protein n=1 Tax=Thlaspi arvense TaxID=13288 RepID=A0AAU9T932_THLAR|nr:unnamed protein product [Thlaspi arvense]
MVLISVETDELKPSFTCGICYNIIDHATTLTGCLHTFCWRCIHGNITEHAWKCCPVCYADLGPTPLRTLKHNEFMEKLRRAFFPSSLDVIVVDSDSESSVSPSDEDVSDGDNSAA